MNADLARAAFYLVVTRIVFGVTRRALRERVANPSIVNAHARAIELARAVDRVARHLPLRTSCLDRAVALWWLLVRNGAGGALRIGVRREGDALAAHAWVEHEGEVLFDDEVAQRYVAL
ncbi:MAG TPA: lasso peptide biosynthesis B2 protein [Thermoanaerobaculia bacterium]|nr:lasso peptide biosynthesis B2 protein [Thermoanaerobaculia bacterium]